MSTCALPDGFGDAMPTALPHSLTPEVARALLEWQIAMGADEAIGDIAPNRLAPPLPARMMPAVPAVPRPPPVAARTIVAPPNALAAVKIEEAQAVDRGSST